VHALTSVKSRVLGLFGFDKNFVHPSPSLRCCLCMQLERWGVLQVRLTEIEEECMHAACTCVREERGREGTHNLSLSVRNFKGSSSSRAVGVLFITPAAKQNKLATRPFLLCLQPSPASWSPRPAPRHVVPPPQHTGAVVLPLPPHSYSLTALTLESISAYLLSLGF
jgi:hypothetical protein